MSAPVSFEPNPCAPSHFITAQVDTVKIVHSWQHSILSFEWLKNGALKPVDTLTATQKAAYSQAQASIRTHTPLPMPILGIGIMDGVEIGSGHAVVMALLSENITHFQAHIPPTNTDEFKPYA